MTLYMPGGAAQSNSDKLIAKANARYFFRINNLEFTLFLRPQEVSVELPNRVAAVEALHGQHFDAFGRGVGHLTIQATTGWRGYGLLTGAGLHKRLKDAYLVYVDLVNALGNPDVVRFDIINDVFGTSYRVVPTTWQDSASRSNPLIQNFTMQCIIVSDNLHPEPDATLAPYLVADAPSLGGITFPQSDAQVTWGRGLADAARNLDKTVSGTAPVTTYGKYIQRGDPLAGDVHIQTVRTG